MPARRRFYAAPAVGLVRGGELLRGLARHQSEHCRLRATSVLLRVSGQYDHMQGDQGWKPRSRRMPPLASNLFPNRLAGTQVGLRGQRVMLDADLAALYAVGIRALNQAVKRNIGRFPPDYMFQLTAEEADVLRSQFVTLKPGRGRHRKYLPYVFTEQGVAMLSSMPHNERAIQLNIEIMRAFVRLRKFPASDAELARKPAELENRYDAQFSGTTPCMGEGRC